MQARGVTNLKAADHIGFVKVKGGYEAYITEITTGNKPLDQLTRQLEGGFKIAQGDRQLGHLTNDFKYRVVTDNKQLVDALKVRGNQLRINRDLKDITVIFTGGDR